MSGASTTDEAFHLYSKSKACLKEGGFNLRRFVSNSPQLKEKIDLAEGVPVVKSCNNVSVEDESYSRATLGANQGKATETEQKVLGVVWNVQRDCLVFDLCHIAEAAAIADETKRGIASVSTRFYDPIGVLSPCIVMFKLLPQKIWESGLDWTRWRQEYLVALQDRHRHSTNMNKSIHIQKGGVCVLQDPHCPRTFWRLAIIQDPIPGRDGQVRGAVVKTITRKGVVIDSSSPNQILISTQNFQNCWQLQ